MFAMLKSEEILFHRLSKRQWYKPETTIYSFADSESVSAIIT